MPFDLSSLITQATEVTNQSSTDQDGKKYPRIIYPGMGTLRVKLLYNPKSNLVSRMIRRHKVHDTNYTCLKTYGQDCPICKTVENINNSLGLDLWQFNAKARGLSYAQYVGSEGYTWDKDFEEPQVGELILLMYPWQVYQDINRIISTAGVNAAELIAKNDGKVLNIIHSKVNGRHEYKAEADAFSQPFRSCASDAEFENYLNEIPDLNDTITARELTQELLGIANDVSETLSREYLRGVQGSMSGGFNSNTISGVNQVVEVNGQQYVNVNGQLMPITPTPMPVPQPAPQVAPAPVPQVSPVSPQMPQNYMNPPVAPNPTPVAPVSQQVSTPVPQQGTPAVTTADGQQMPECFGQHKDGDPKCMVCLHEINCLAVG